jgi:hypothetical protein
LTGKVWHGCFLFSVQIPLTFKKENWGFLTKGVIAGNQPYDQKKSRDIATGFFILD